MEMKEKLLKLLTERKEIYFLDLPDLMPEIKGEYSIYMPVKKGANPNILWLANTTQAFIKVFNELLIEEKIIEWKMPQSMATLLIEGKPVYGGIPLANNKLVKSNKHCWAPIIIMFNK